MYRVTEDNRAVIPAFRLVSALLDDPDSDCADVICGLAGSPINRYNAVIWALGRVAADALKLLLPNNAQAVMLNAIAYRLDAEEEEIRQAFDNILSPGKNNLIPSQSSNER